MTLRCARPERRRPHGFTLIETLITVAVLAILAAIAVPSMADFIARKKVEGVADQLLMDLRYAKSLQSSTGNDIVFKLKADANQTCYVIYDYSTVSSCDCLNATVCQSAAIQRYRLVQLPKSEGLKIEAETTTSLIRLYGEMGAPISPATNSPTPTLLELKLKVSSPNGGAIRVQTNQAFLPEACDLSGHKGAYSPCPPTP